MGGKLPLGYGYALLAYEFDQFIQQYLGSLRISSVSEAGPSALTGIAVECEVAYQ